MPPSGLQFAREKGKRETSEKLPHKLSKVERKHRSPFIKGSVYTILSRSTSEPLECIHLKTAQPIFASIICWWEIDTAVEGCCPHQSPNLNGATHTINQAPNHRLEGRKTSQLIIVVGLQTHGLLILISNRHQRRSLSLLKSELEKKEANPRRIY